jgi:hypothetical protein
MHGITSDMVFSFYLRLAFANEGLIMGNKLPRGASAHFLYVVLMAAVHRGRLGSWVLGRTPRAQQAREIDHI